MMETTQGILFDVRKYSIHDGPGIRTAVFFKGCPLSCQWCHNPEGQSPAPEILFRENLCEQCGECIKVCFENAVRQEGSYYYTDMPHCILCSKCIDVCTSGAREVAGKTMTVAEVMEIIERDIPFYDESSGGVTFSGGEPLQQRRFLQELLIACKEKEIHTTLDTCGFVPWEVLDSVRGYVDLFLYDVKLVDETKHKTYTGVSNHIILENLARLSKLGHRIIIRVPLIPGITDTEENIEQIGVLARGLSGVERVDLLPYHDIAIQKYHRLGIPYPLEGLAPISDQMVQEAVDQLKKYDLPISIGG